MLSEQDRKEQEAYDLAHANSDVDNENTSIHHTLGKGPTQAAPGNHKHSDTTPVGTIIMWGSAVLPSGGRYLNLDGTLLLRADYPDLFNHYGITHNTGGEPGTHFRLPNTMGKFVLGVSGAHLLGSTGGAETHTLTQAELPEHTHEVRGGLNAIAADATDSFSRSNTHPGDASFRTGGVKSTSTYGSADVVTDQPHNNMPPFLTLFLLVKALP